jgi:hypothetical protein
MAFAWKASGLTYVLAHESPSSSAAIEFESSRTEENIY